MTKTYQFRNPRPNISRLSKTRFVTRIRKTDQDAESAVRRKSRSACHTGYETYTEAQGRPGPDQSRVYHA